MSKSKSKQEQKMVSIGYSHLPSTYGLRTLKKTQHGDDVIPALPSQHKSTTFRLLVKEVYVYNTTFDHLYGKTGFEHF